MLTVRSSAANSSLHAFNTFPSYSVAGALCSVGSHSPFTDDCRAAMCRTITCPTGSHSRSRGQTDDPPDCWTLLKKKPVWHLRVTPVIFRKNTSNKIETQIKLGWEYENQFSLWAAEKPKDHTHNDPLNLKPVLMDSAYYSFLSNAASFTLRFKG